MPVRWNDLLGTTRRGNTMGYELERAMLEAERNAAVDAYIEARPQLDSIHNRRIFEAGFERAWNLRQKEIDALTVPNKD